MKNYNIIILTNETCTLCFLTVGVEMGDWQEVWDENSGCYYYWNTLTNEVSWELPHYLANQVQNLGQYTHRWEKQINFFHTIYHHVRNKYSSNGNLLYFACVSSVVQVSMATAPHMQVFKLRKLLLPPLPA